MATNPVQIPFSNPGGKNQTNPSPIFSSPSSSMPIPGSPSANMPGANPYIPPGVSGSTGSGTAPMQSVGGPGTTSSAQNGFITSSNDGSQNALQKQLTDIYGQGTGGSLFSLLNNMSGTDSTILQEYIQSLQPQMATAQANTNAALGAGGVGANSSVAALADANLQSNEQASIASESAALTQNQEQLTAQILQGTENASAKEVATSGWSIFGDVASDITGDIGHLFGGSVNTAPGSQGQSAGSAVGQTMAGMTNASSPSGSTIQATDPSLYNPTPIAGSEDLTAGEDAGLSLAAFA